jgi:hypothetical protein
MNPCLTQAALPPGILGGGGGCQEECWVAMTGPAIVLFHYILFQWLQNGEVESESVLNWYAATRSAIQIMDPQIRIRKRNTDGHGTPACWRNLLVRATLTLSAMSAICMLLRDSGPCGAGLAGLLCTTPSLLLLAGLVAGQSGAAPPPPPCSLLGLCAGPPLGLCRSRLIVLKISENKVKIF